MGTPNVVSRQVQIGGELADRLVPVDELLRRRIDEHHGVLGENRFDGGRQPGADAPFGPVSHQHLAVVAARAAGGSGSLRSKLVAVAVVAEVIKHRDEINIGSRTRLAESHRTEHQHPTSAQSAQRASRALSIRDRGRAHRRVVVIEVSPDGARRARFRCCDHLGLC